MSVQRPLGRTQVQAMVLVGIAVRRHVVVVRLDLLDLEQLDELVRLGPRDLALPMARRKRAHGAEQCCFG